MKVAIIGVGAMGSALAKGLAAQKVDLLLENPDNPRVTKLAQALQVPLCHTATDVINAHPDLVLLVTPAPITLAVAKTLAGLDQQTIVISSAVGVRLADLATVLPGRQLAAIIPNTPVAVNDGAIGLSFADDTDAKTQQRVIDLLQNLGTVIQVNESDLNIVGTIGGCGPAYVDVFMDALADAAVAHSLDRATAYRLAAAMVKGSGSLALATKLAPALLRDQVTSPGGTTIKGVLALEKDGFRHAVIDAVNHSTGD